MSTFQLIRIHSYSSRGVNNGTKSARYDPVNTGATKNTGSNSGYEVHHSAVDNKQ